MFLFSLRIDLQNINLTLWINLQRQITHFTLLSSEFITLIVFEKWSFQLPLREKCPNPSFFWPVFSCIQSKYRKIRTRKNSVFGDFSPNGLCNYQWWVLTDIPKNRIFNFERLNFRLICEWVIRTVLEFSALLKYQSIIMCWSLVIH